MHWTSPLLGRRHHRRASAALRRTPVSHRHVAEQQFRHTAWIERKPGAMRQATTAPRAVDAR
ncbi:MULTISPECIES: hypothetical protein [Saccharopolyspora]|uniref:Uncharacterized protein n=1 Tax=Saccharopolyspora cebuensis TaxID=418759 RepID=A0ABV4CKY1_9PSEU